MRRWRRALLAAAAAGAAGDGGGSSRLIQCGTLHVSRANVHTLPLSHPVICIWGSNTGVGKTLFSAALAAACARAQVDALYLKPVQTGFPESSDAALVASVSGGTVAVGPHAAALLPANALHKSSTSASSSSSSTTTTTSGGSIGCDSAPRGPGVVAWTLFAWQQAVSPHVAVQREGRPVADGEVVSSLAAEIGSFASTAVFSSLQQRLTVVETAGGVASPGPSGTLQCDLLRPLRLPGLLVGDGRLGGISATLSALDSLLLRGYDVPLVVLMDDSGSNQEAMQQHVGRRAQVLAFPVCRDPPAGAGAGASQAASWQHYQQHHEQQQQQQLLPGAGLQPPDANLQTWLDSTRPQFDQLLTTVQQHHATRLAALQAAAAEGRQILWWPFTQHGNVQGDEAVTVIDGRAGESFSVFRSAQPVAGNMVASGPGGATTTTTTTTTASSGSTSSSTATTGSPPGPAMQLQYDACASWWTQGLSQQAQPQLVAAVAQAAGRYGHVMYPENVHQPALELARGLLSTVGRGWAGRVFFSDNGSTAIEVALKMAFRKFMVDRGLLEDSACELQVVALQEGYHGDTLGAMDAVAPSPYNGRLQTPWYRGRGLFLDPPTAGIFAGQWQVALPPGLEAETALTAASTAGAAAGPSAAVFSSREGLFDPGRDASPLAEAYRGHIRQQMAAHAAAHPSARLGACIIEPLVQGAGGMRLIDPLFHRVLVKACRQEGIPIVFDEVFTAFWRLGERSAAEALGVTPDIACYAKLLTGGLLPLAATLATPAVFEAFQSDSKLHALLHGHSYSAHAVGCAAGAAALQLLSAPALNPNLCTPEVSGRCQRGGACEEPCGRLLPLWDEDRVVRLSCHPAVQRAMVLGTVVALELRADGTSGYASNAAQRVTAALRQAGVFARPLGNVVYLMVTPSTDRQQCAALLAQLEAALG